MARTVRDAAILLGVLTGVDEEDAVTKNSMDKAQKDYTPFLILMVYRANASA
jgi:amidase